MQRKPELTRDCVHAGQRQVRHVHRRGQGADRELRTLVARNNWKVSAGTCTRSSRDGMAALRLPNSARRPAEDCARPARVQAVSQYQAAKDAKLRDSNLATPGSCRTPGQSRPPAHPPRLQKSVLLEELLERSMRAGRTMNNSPVMKAVMSAFPSTGGCGARNRGQTATSPAGSRGPAAATSPRSRRGRLGCGPSVPCPPCPSSRPRWRTTRRSQADCEPVGPRQRTLEDLRRAAAAPSSRFP